MLSASSGFWPEKVRKHEVFDFVALVGCGSCGARRLDFFDLDQNCPVNKTHGPFDDCPLSCYLLTPRTQPEQCTRRLNIGCKCQEGFVLLEHKVFSSKCIKPEDCPPEP
uniref:TIL domain-containing protein n=1 Tax=Araneus ventricosus TaxID=182803 RepID=A0A4Y2SL12_ARAVE|nr:hypothetical protein AVEN_69296-1 [Araneus ventricosus]